MLELVVINLPIIGRFRKKGLGFWSVLRFLELLEFHFLSKIQQITFKSFRSLSLVSCMYLSREVGSDT